MVALERRVVILTKSRKTRKLVGQVFEAKRLETCCWKSRRSHFYSSSVAKVYTYIIKNAGEEGVHFDGGYAGLKKHFIERNQYSGRGHTRYSDKCVQKPV